MIKVQVINKEGTIIAEAAGTREVNLPVSRTYEEGDRVVFLVDETPAFYVFQADDALGEALVYVTGEVSYEIPFGEKKVCYSPKIFSGESHLITARKAREWEYESYRNLAVNVWISTEILIAIRTQQQMLKLAVSPCLQHAMPLTV